MHTPVPDFLHEHLSPSSAASRLIVGPLAVDRILFRTDLFRQSAVHQSDGSESKFFALRPIVRL